MSRWRAHGSFKRCDEVLAVPGAGSTFDNGWGLGLIPVDIANGKATVDDDFAYFTTSIVLTFSPDGTTATGTIASIAPALSPVGPKPEKALFCTSPKQSVT